MRNTETAPPVSEAAEGPAYETAQHVAAADRPGRDDPMITDDPAMAAEAEAMPDGSSALPPDPDAPASDAGTNHARRNDTGTDTGTLVAGPDARLAGAATDDRPDHLAAHPQIADAESRAAGADGPGAVNPGAIDSGAREIPGDVPPLPRLWRADEAESLRARWRDIQLRFVDDPHAAAAEADGLINDAVSALTRALTERRDDLAGWQSTNSSDTEGLRVAVQRYRTFLDSLLDLEHAGVSR